MNKREYGFTPKMDWKVARADREALENWMQGNISDDEACGQIAKNNGLDNPINICQLISFAMACGYLSRW